MAKTPLSSCFSLAFKLSWLNSDDTTNLLRLEYRKTFCCKIRNAHFGCSPHRLLQTGFEIRHILDVLGTRRLSVRNHVSNLLQKFSLCAGVTREVENSPQHAIGRLKQENRDLRGQFGWSLCVVQSYKDSSVTFVNTYRLHSSDLELCCGGIQLFLGEVILMVDVTEQIFTLFIWLPIIQLLVNVKFCCEEKESCIFNLLLHNDI